MKQSSINCWTAANIFWIILFCHCYYQEVTSRNYVSCDVYLNKERDIHGTYFWTLLTVRRYNGSRSCLRNTAALLRNGTTRVWRKSQPPTQSWGCIFACVKFKNLCTITVSLRWIISRGVWVKLFTIPDACIINALFLVCEISLQLVFRENDRYQKLTSNNCIG